MAVLSKRWERNPSGRVVIITPRDVQLFKLLNRYGVLRTSTICAFLGKRMTERLRPLFNEGGYVARIDTRRRLGNAGNQDLVYGLSWAGRQELRRHGVEPIEAIGRATHLHHRLMTVDIVSSIELGCIERGLRFITWEEIQRAAPAKEIKGLYATTVVPHTPTLKVSVPYGGKEYPLVPDALFGVGYPDGSYRFFALEADQGTEPLKRKTLYGSSYEKKLLLYSQLLLNKGYSHWGIPNLLLLNVTVQDEKDVFERPEAYNPSKRMENIKALTMEVTKNQGNSAMLFKTYKGSPFYAPPADGHMLTEPWDRARYPQLDITKP